MASSQPNGIAEPDHQLIPSTPPQASEEITLNRRISLSQQSIPDTEIPASPIDPNASFKTELNDDRISPPSPPMIHSSVTPPPSSQLVQTNTHTHTNNNTTSSFSLGYASLQRTNSMISPPLTTLNIIGRSRTTITEYIPPTTHEMENANMDELKFMLQSSLSVNAKLKSETAHYKLQYELLSMQAVEDANRAHVEHEMTRREVTALRIAEHARQAKRELDARVDLTQIKYRELQHNYDALTKQHNDLARRIKSAAKLVQQQAEEIESLHDERNMLLNRIRENRQHFQMLCSPGGAFHGALTPKTPSTTSPQQSRTTPRQTPKSANKGARHETETGGAGFEALLQALNQDNNSAPTTPTSANRPATRAPFGKHRATHSLSSLPATPFSRSRGNPGLLPSIDLVPRTEPAQRFGNRVEPQTPTPRKHRKSRESTISAEDETEGNARTMTLESVAAAAQFYMSRGSHHSQSSRRRIGEEEEVYESQASQAASEMLRRDPRESFDVESSVNSRDVTPAPLSASAPVPGEKSTRLQQTMLYAPVQKAGVSMEKRKFGGSNSDDRRGEVLSSPAKKMRYGADGPVGLGIQHTRRRG